MNILYLSDIHFGRELIASGSFTNRTQIQDQLIQTVSTLPANMRPHYIVVTGDIAWTGAAEEYDMAYDWFSRLLAELQLSGEKIALCAGNHDINRKIAVQTPLAELKDNDGFILEKIDEKYKFENICFFDVQLHAYNDFCHKLGVIPYEYRCDIQGPLSDKLGFSNHWYSYTVGSKDFSFGDEKYRFIAFNTAMLSGYEELPDDENFIGLPQVEQLLAENRIGKNTNHYKISLFHHAERFLNSNELNSYSERPATLYKLLEHTDLALCGHTETGAIPIPRKQGNNGILINGGAAYYSDDHPNSFSILHLDPATHSFDNCTFIYKNGEWLPQLDLKTFNWQVQAATINSSSLNISKDTWTFRLLGKNNQKDVLLKHVDFGLYIDGKEAHAYFSNHKDINRLLDLSGDQYDLRVGVAPGRERSVEALLEHISIPYFVDQQLKNGDIEVKYLLIDPAETPVVQGIMPVNVFSDKEYFFYNFLLRLRKLEEAFHVRFSAPSSFSVREQCAVTILEEYLTSGGGIFVDTTPNRVVYFSDQQAIFRFVYERLSADPQKTICISYCVPIVCNLFGAKIKLGKCEIIMANLIPCHLKDVAKQANTFMDGDKRRLTLKYINDHQQIVIIKDGSEQYSPDVQDMMNKIKANTILLEIEPQGMTFGIDLFTPDERFANSIGLFPKDNLKLMITKQ